MVLPTRESSLLLRLAGTECGCGRHIDVCGGCADKVWASTSGPEGAITRAISQKTLSRRSSHKSIYSTGILDDTNRTSNSLSDEPELLMLLDLERSVRLWKPSIMVVILGGVLAFNILKGSKGSSPLGIECGSASYWSLSLMIIPWVMIFMVFIRYLVLEEYKNKVRVNFPFVEGDMRWSLSSTIRYPIICVTAGLVAGE